MNSETREERITDIMSEIVNSLSREGPLSLSSMSKPYCHSEEMSPCLIAFSRLEAEGLIVQHPDGKWRVAEKD